LKKNFQILRVVYLIVRASYDYSTEITNKRVNLDYVVRDKMIHNNLAFFQPIRIMLFEASFSVI